LEHCRIDRGTAKEFDKRDDRILDWTIAELTGGQQKSLPRGMAVVEWNIAELTGGEQNIYRRMIESSSPNYALSIHAAHSPSNLARHSV
jgi:hypothetical protein